MRSAHQVAAIILTLGVAGAVCAEDDTKEEAKPKKPPRTLLSWQPGGEDQADDNGEAEEEDVIQTDRPDFTEASSTVGQGRIQLESGYTYSRDKDSGVTSSHSFPEALFRIGLFADWFELRIAQNYSSTRTRGTDGGVFTADGAPDLYLGVKLGLTEQKGYLPETALILQTTVPTGPRTLTAGRVLPGVNYLFGWNVIPDLLTFGGSFQGNAAVDDDGNNYVELSQSLTVGYILTKKLGAYTEFFSFYPHGARAADTVARYFFDGGFTYKITPNFQTDVRGGVGLNRHADDYFVGAGFAVRY